VAQPYRQLHHKNSRLKTISQFYSSLFPIFSLGSTASISDIRETVVVINEQARAELCLGEAEFAEMGYAAAFPQPW
jgi:hypothetical protein